MAGAFFVFRCATAAAQSAEPADNAVVRFGPLAMTPGLSVPSFGLDSNVFNESQNPRKDFTANVQPSVDAWLRYGRVRVAGRQQFNLLYFQDNASERAANSASSVKAELMLVWATPHASVSYVKTKDRADPVIDVRAVNRSRPVSAGIDFRLSSRTNLDLGADDNRISFDRGPTFGNTSLQSALDRNTRNYHATLRYAATAPTTLSLRVARQQERFSFATSQNNDSLRIVPGVNFAADALITGSVEVGVLSFKPNSDTLKPVTAILSSVDVGYVLLGVTRFQVSVSRDVTPSIDSEAAYALQTVATGTVTHRVADRWEVNVSASRLLMDFGTVRPDAATAFDRTDVVRTYAAGLGFFFNQGLRLGLRAEALKRTSVLPTGQYDNLRLLSSINYTRK